MDSLTYDWNAVGGAAARPAVMLDDETLRDGLQCPSVETPSIERKLEILHLMEALGMDTADIGLPAAGAAVAADVERITREIIDCRMKLRPNAAARTMINDITPIAEISQRTGMPIEVAAFIGSSPLRQYVEDWTVDHLERTTEQAVAFAVKEGLPIFLVTEDSTRADPETLRRIYSAAIRAGAHRVCIADTVGHATPAGTTALVRFVAGVVEDCGGGIGIDWHGHRDRGMAIANTLAAIDAGATRVHGTALGIGERVGNTQIDLLLVNLVLMGYIQRDLTRLGDYCRVVSEATRRADSRQLSGGRPRRLPHGDGRPCRRRHKSVQEEQTGHRRFRLFQYSRPSGGPGAGDRDRADVGPVERGLLAGAPGPGGHGRDGRIHLRRREERHARADRRRSPRARAVAARSLRAGGTRNAPCTTSPRICATPCVCFARRPGSRSSPCCRSRSGSDRRRPSSAW